MKTYITTASVNHRKGATTDSSIIRVIPLGSVVVWTGYSFITGNTEWKLVEYSDQLGFCSTKYLREL